MKSWWRPSCSQLLPEFGITGGLSPAESRGDLPLGGHVVDAHVHVFPPEMIRDREALLVRDSWFGTLYSSPQARMATVDDVIVEMDETGVEMALVFGFAFKDQGLCRMVNDYVIEAVAKYPRRIAGLACVSPEETGAQRELERCLDAGLKGCGELSPDGQGFVAGRPGVDAVAACLRERSAPLLVHASEPVGHAYPGKGRFTPKECVSLAAAHPELTIVLAHMGGGLFLYELMPELREALARVYYDTAAVPYLYDPKVYAVALACVGTDKIILGSDYPLLSARRYFEQLNGLAAAERAAISGENARKVFGL